MADVTSPFGFPYPEDTDLVRDGAQDIENLATGVNDYLAGGYLYAGTRNYTSSGTFVKADAFGDSSNVVPRAIRVRLVGAGGGGGGTASTSGAQSAQGSPGGAGGYAESFITDIAGLDASITVTLGGGGSAGSAGNNAGSSGGASSFGSLVAASGGDGGAAEGNATSTFPKFGSVRPGGNGTAGDIQARGGAASLSILTADSPGGTFAALGLAGASQFSAGPRNGVNADGIAGTLGSGGSAPWVISGAPARPGGAGGNGVIYVDIYV
jgi:hypothetical protein